MKIINESGVEKETSLLLSKNFQEFYDVATEWNEKAKTLVVTNANQVTEMKMAKEARLILRDIRVNADKTRKALKEESLRYGKAVQSVYNVIESLIVPTEKYLEEQEKFVQIQEEKRKAELTIEREFLLKDYREFVPFGIYLSELSDADFQKILSGAKLQFKEREESVKRQEEERIEREKSEKEQQIKDIEKRIREETELKLRTEHAEREISEQKLKEKEKEQLKSVPDKIKLLKFADTIDSLVCDEVGTEDAHNIEKNAIGLLRKVSSYIREKSNKL